MYKLCNEKCILQYNGTIYNDVKFIGGRFDHQELNTTFVVNSLVDRIKNIQSIGYKIPKGSKIYLANSIPIDIETIRKTYTIKRKPEDADYIVMAPIKKHCYHQWANPHRFYYTASIFVSTRLLENGDLEDIISDYGLVSLPYVTLDEMDFTIINDPKDCISKYLTNSFPKPVASYTDLDLQAGDDLDCDVLSLTYRLGKKIWTITSNDVNNYILNLKALNNYNWRKYKGTLSIMFKCLAKDINSSHRCVSSKLNSQCKTVYDIIKSCDSSADFENIEDLQLAQEFFSQLLNMNQFPMFVKPTTLLSKIYEIHMPVYDFERVFCTITKITKNVELKNEN